MVSLYVFSSYISFFKAVFCWKHYKIVLSAEHSFCVSQLVNPPFEGKTQNCTLKPKCYFGLSSVPAQTPIFIVFGDVAWLQERCHFPKQIVATKCAFFFPNTNSVCLFFKKCNFQPKHLFTTTPKTQFFWAFFEKFLFQFIHISLFFQHKKDKKQKVHIFYRKPFLTPWQTAQKYFRTPTHYLWFLRYPKTLEIGENKQTKSWTKFWPNLGPPKSWTKFWLYSTYIYVYIHIPLYIYVHTYRVFPFQLSVYTFLSHRP